MRRTIILLLLAAFPGIMVSKIGAVAAAEEQVLDEVVVTATRTTMALEDAPQRVEIIDRRGLEAAGGKVDAALEKLPAVLVNRSGGDFMAALPSIRGSQPGEVLVLVDGRRLNSQQSGWFNLADLPVPAILIDRVEVLSAPSSALYGAEAMGGVINVITRDPGALPGVRLAGTLGSFDRFGSELLLSGRAGEAGLAAVLGVDMTAGDRENSDARQDRANLYATLPTGDSTIGFSFGYLGRDMGSPGPVKFPSPDARQTDDLRVWDLRWEGQAAENLVFSAVGFWNRYRRTYEDAAFGLDAAHVTNTGGFSLQGTMEAGRLGRWTAGAEGIWDKVDSTDAGRHGLDRQGFYMQEEVSLSPSWSAVITGRFDRYSLFDDQFSPRAAVVWHPRERLTMRASVSRGYRTPTFDDLFWNDPYAHGNPDLAPEKSWNWELGASGKTGGSARWGLDLFRRDVKGLINWQDADGDWVYSPENIASARISGATATFRAYVSEGTLVDLSWTYIDPLDLDKDAPIPARPRHQAKAAVSWRFNLVEADLNLAWIKRYPDPNLDHVSYWSSGLRLGRTWTAPGTGRLGISLRADNLLNAAYQVTPGYPMPGRSFSVDVSWEH